MQREREREKTGCELFRKHSRMLTSESKSNGSEKMLNTNKSTEEKDIALNMLERIDGKVFFFLL